MRQTSDRSTVQRMMVGFGVPAMAAVLLAALLVGLGPARAAPPGTVSLMETLSEWKYPGSTMRGGASMGDGGNPRVPSLKCRAILTTPDPIDKVIAFYSEKVGVDPANGRQVAKAGANDDDAMSAAAQDDSRGRPVTLRVIVVNRAETATTVVISRAEGETETHIAWLHYLRL